MGDPLPTYTYEITRANLRHPQLAEVAPRRPLGVLRVTAEFLQVDEVVDTADGLIDGITGLLP